jgi:hypothetical protein
MSKPRKSKAAPPAVTAQPASELILYQTDDNQTRIEVRLEGETVWLTQKLMSELFQKDVRTINEHIQNIFEEGELSPESVIRKFRITAADGKSHETQHYNLNVIISVGYRVKSYHGTQFRIWATQRLREYIVKGFVLDDERLKNPDQPFDYFEELTSRIQEIRTSERRFCQKITDIYATSIDYDPTQEIRISFFKTVQNKVHWAITGQTAAEIVHQRADAAKCRATAKISTRQQAPAIITIGFKTSAVVTSGKFAPAGFASGQITECPSIKRASTKLQASHVSNFRCQVFHHSTPLIKSSGSSRFSRRRR